METPISDCLIPIHSEEFLDALIDDEQDEYMKAYFQWKKEHPMQSATPMPEWI